VGVETELQQWNRIVVYVQTYALDNHTYYCWNGYVFLSSPTTVTVTARGPDGVPVPVRTFYFPVGYALFYLP